MNSVVITGAKSGLGMMIYHALSKQGLSPIDWSLPAVDVSDSHSVAKASELISGNINLLVNCAGINRIDYLPDLKEETWDSVMGANAKGIYLTTQALLEKLRGGTVLNIVSNASNIPMTGSIAYNASKGAAAIMTQQMHRELFKTHGITVFGISPNKLKGTGMSRDIEEQVCKMRGWTKEQAEAYQLAALPVGEETDPETLAEFIAFLLSSKRRHKYLGGCIIPYGGPM